MNHLFYTTIVIGLVSFIVSCGTQVDKKTLRKASASAAAETPKPTDSGQNDDATGNNQSDDENKEPNDEEKPLTYLTDTKPILDEACVKCHNIPVTNGAPETFTLAYYDDVGKIKGVGSSLEALKKVIKEGAMPADAHTLSDDQKVTMLTWIDEGGEKGEGDELDPPKPGLYFISPAEDEVMKVDQSVEIKVQRVRLEDTISWKLYYSTEPESVSTGTLIAENLTGADTTVTWDTSAVRPTKYFIYAIAKLTDDTDVIYRAEGQVEVTREPVLSLNSHDGEELHLNSSLPDIEWEVANAAGYDLRYIVEYKVAGGDYQVIPGADGIAATTFAWDISNTMTYPEAASYMIRISAYDSRDTEKFVAKVESKSAFGIAAAEKTYWQDVYPKFSGCEGCHTGEGSGVGIFNMEDYSLTLQGAFQNQERLSKSLRKTMPPGDPASFPEADLEVVKLWDWGGGAEGTPSDPQPVVNLTSFQLDDVVIVNAVDSFNIEWESANIDGLTVTYVVEYKKGADAYQVIPGAEALTVTSFSWDTSHTMKYPIDDSYKIRVKLMVDGEMVARSIAESQKGIGIVNRALTYTNDIKPGLTNAMCQNCHMAGNAPGGYDIENFAYFNVAGKDQVLYDRLGPNGNMPPGNPNTYPAADLLLIKLWIWSGSNE